MFYQALCTYFVVGTIDPALCTPLLTAWRAIESEESHPLCSDSFAGPLAGSNALSIARQGAKVSECALNQPDEVPQSLFQSNHLTYAAL